jgi:hypothetical protein
MSETQPAPTISLLQLLTPLFLRDLGQTLEGDVFQVLKQSPFIVRSLEFALADGAIDCSRERPATTSFAERLWNVFSYEPEEDFMSDLIYLDVKSGSADDERSHQDYMSIEGQCRKVGVWVCISAANSAWVDVIPNRHQTPEGLMTFDSETPFDDSQRKVQHVGALRDSRLHNAAHGFLDPCATPYRMPLSMLPEAITRIRRCALGLGDYINPWTGVIFKGWRPITTRRTEWLKPSEESSHYTAYQDAWEVFRGFRSQEVMEFDLVGIQPCLSDYKILQYINNSITQHFVQAKGDGVMRGPNNKLTKVGAARQGRYYFDTRDR